MGGRKIEGHHENEDRSESTESGSKSKNGTSPGRKGRELSRMGGPNRKSGRRGEPKRQSNDGGQWGWGGGRRGNHEGGEVQADGGEKSGASRTYHGTLGVDVGERVFRKATKIAFFNLVEADFVLVPHPSGGGEGVVAKGHVMREKSGGDPTQVGEGGGQIGRASCRERV